MPEVTPGGFLSLCIHKSYIQLPMLSTEMTFSKFKVTRSATLSSGSNIPGSDSPPLPAQETSHLPRSPPPCRQLLPLHRGASAPPHTLSLVAAKASASSQPPKSSILLPPPVPGFKFRFLSPRHRRPLPTIPWKARSHFKHHMPKMWSLGGTVSASLRTRKSKGNPAPPRAPRGPELALPTCPPFPLVTLLPRCWPFWPIDTPELLSLLCPLWKCSFLRSPGSWLFSSPSSLESLLCPLPAVSQCLVQTLAQGVQGRGRRLASPLHPCVQTWR